ncbi:MAG: hypothetical protein ACJASQ_003404 [Crocinitomicaceae bacterium]|jgi:hypothetical protein
MTENELKTILGDVHLLKGTSRPSHEIIISFECPVEDLNDIDRFVTVVQTRLNELKAGTLDIFGVNVDASSGEFLIRCNETMNIESIYNEIRPILDDYSFFDYSHVALLMPQTGGGYQTKTECIKESNTLEDNDPDLPIPDGVNSAKSTGCLGQLTILLSIGLTLLAFYY